LLDIQLFEETECGGLKEKPEMTTLITTHPAIMFFSIWLVAAGVALLFMYGAGPSMDDDDGGIR
jgi:hypothetical protein